MNKITYIAFLRGINVNGRIIKNTDLQICFENMGFNHIKIILQSGNVIFESSEDNHTKLKTSIEKSLEKRFKYPAKIILTDLATLTTIIKKYPFDNSDISKQQYVVFLSEDVRKELLTAEKLDSKVEEIKSGDMVVYWTVTKGMTLKSVFGKLVAKAKYRDISTTRNLNTLQKIFI
jgi:uncharacterized protein (DUF1697 family)